MSRAVSCLILAVLVLGLVSSAFPFEAQGIRGRAALGGLLVEGVEVRAYPHRPGTFGPLTGETPAGSATVAIDGTYRIPLPVGRYVVEALKKADGNRGSRPETGDLHCLYSGSPVTVAGGAWTPVGLNLVEVPTETRTRADRSGLSGTITHGGEPVERVYLYVYTDASTGFRGPAHFLQPVATGSFRLRLPPGTYHLVARKRARGGPYGPIEIGDLLNFYPRNPVVVEEGDRVTLEIPLVERLSQLEEEPDAYQGTEIRVVDPSGRGQQGYHVLAYSNPMRAGPPMATSPRTDGEGRTRLALTPGETVYLRARKTLGGPLTEGEVYADAETSGEGDAGLLLTVESGR